MATPKRAMTPQVKLQSQNRKYIREEVKRISHPSKTFESIKIIRLFTMTNQ